MNKISKISDIIAYHEVFNDKSNRFDERFKKLPADIQEIITQDKTVLVKHLSKELFKDMLISELKKINPEYRVDEHSSQIIDIFSLYFTKDTEFLKLDSSYSFSKGLLIMGKVGCGKTLLFKALSSLKRYFPSFDYYNSDLREPELKSITAYKIVESFAVKGFEIFEAGIYISGSSFNANITKSIYFIDDIGSENICTHYGSTTNVLAEVFLRRYDLQSLTFCTTNLDPKNLKQFYGERIYSKMTEMMNFIIMEGTDRRR